MGTDRKAHTSPRTRPVKKTRERVRRIKTQKKRLIALGLSEDYVCKLNTKQIRALLRKPGKLQA